MAFTSDFPELAGKKFYTEEQAYNAEAQVEAERERKRKEAATAAESQKKEALSSEAMKQIGKFNQFPAVAKERMDMAASDKGGTDWATLPKDQLAKLAEGQILKEQGYDQPEKQPMRVAREFGLTANQAPEAKDFVKNIETEQTMPVDIAYKNAMAGTVLTAEEKAAKEKAAAEERARQRLEDQDFRRQMQEDQQAFQRMMYDVKKPGSSDKDGNDAIDPDTGKPYTAAQSIAAGYALRANESSTIADRLYSSGFDAGKIQNAVMNPDKLNAIKDPKQRQYVQASRNFINSILRPESGAVIAKEEFAEAYKQYFPQIGDDPETQEQKRQNRVMKIAALKAQAGNAYGRAQKEYESLMGSGNSSKSPATSPATDYLDEVRKRRELKGR